MNPVIFLQARFEKMLLVIRDIPFRCYMWFIRKKYNGNIPEDMQKKLASKYLKIDKETCDIFRLVSATSKVIDRLSIVKEESVLYFRLGRSIHGMIETDEDLQFNNELLAFSRQRPLRRAIFNRMGELGDINPRLIYLKLNPAEKLELDEWLDTEGQD